VGGTGGGGVRSIGVGIRIHRWHSSSGLLLSLSGFPSAFFISFVFLVVSSSLFVLL
jgi:hypothetical protein